MKAFLKKFFNGHIVFLFLYFLTSPVSGFSANTDNQCLTFYSEKTTLAKRFLKSYEQNSGGHLGLAINTFLNSEFSDFEKKFESHVAKISAKGTDNKLTSDLSVLQLSLELLDRQMHEIEDLIGPSQFKNLFTSEEGRTKKLDLIAEEFKICRTKMEDCSERLEKILLEVDEIRISINELINDLIHVRKELTDLNSSILFLYQNNTDPSIQIVIDRWLKHVDEKIILAKTILNTHSGLISSSIIVMNAIPITKQKIKELDIKAGSLGLLDKAYAKPKPEVEDESKKEENGKRFWNFLNLKKQKPITAADRIIRIFKTEVTDKEKLDRLSSLVILSYSKFSAEEAYAILKAMPKKVDWGDTKPKSAYSLRIKELSNINWKGHTPLEYSIAYDVAIRTIPSKDNKKLARLVASIILKDRKNRDPLYSSYVEKVVKELKSRLLDQ